MRLRCWPAGVAAAALYLGGVVAMLPATCLDAALARGSGGRLRIAEARGSLWSGSGQFELRDARHQAAVGLATRWQWHPHWRAPLRLLFEIGPAPGERPVAVELTWTSVVIRDLALDLPASALGLIVPALSALQPAGEIRIESGQLRFLDGLISGTALVRWINAGSALTTVWPLGSYEARTDSGAAGGKAFVRTLAGPLRVDGEVSWASASATQWRIEAVAPAASRVQLAPLLGLVGVDRGNGAFSIVSR